MDVVKFVGQLGLTTVLLVLSYFALTRLSATLLAAVVSRKGWRVHIGSVRWMCVMDVWMTCEKGNLAALYLRRVRLQHPNELRAILHAVIVNLASLTVKLPLHVEGVTVHLRSGKNNTAADTQPVSTTLGHHGKQDSSVQEELSLAANGSHLAVLGNRLEQPVSSTAAVQSTCSDASKFASEQHVGTSCSYTAARGQDSHSNGSAESNGGARRQTWLHQAAAFILHWLLAPSRRLLLAVIPVVDVAVHDAVVYEQASCVVAFLPFLGVSLSASALANRLDAALELSHLSAAFLPRSCSGMQLTDARLAQHLSDMMFSCKQHLQEQSSHKHEMPVVDDVAARAAAQKGTPTVSLMRPLLKFCSWSYYLFSLDDVQWRCVVPEWLIPAAQMVHPNGRQQRISFAPCLALESLRMAVRLHYARHDGKVRLGARTIQLQLGRTAAAASPELMAAISGLQRMRGATPRASPSAAAAPKAAAAAAATSLQQNVRRLPVEVSFVWTSFRLITVPSTVGNTADLRGQQDAGLPDVLPLQPSAGFHGVQLSMQQQAPPRLPFRPSLLLLSAATPCMKVTASVSSAGLHITSPSTLHSSTATPSGATTVAKATQPGTFTNDTMTVGKRPDPWTELLTRAACDEDDDCPHSQEARCCTACASAQCGIYVEVFKVSCACTLSQPMGMPVDRGKLFRTSNVKVPPRPLHQVEAEFAVEKVHSGLNVTGLKAAVASAKHLMSSARNSSAGASGATEQLTVEKHCNADSASAAKPVIGADVCQQASGSETHVKDRMARLLDNVAICTRFSLVQGAMLQVHHLSTMQDVSAAAAAAAASVTENAASGAAGTQPKGAISDNQAAAMCVKQVQPAVPHATKDSHDGTVQVGVADQLASRASAAVVTAMQCAASPVRPHDGCEQAAGVARPWVVVRLGALHVVAGPQDCTQQQLQKVDALVQGRGTAEKSRPSAAQAADVQNAEGPCTSPRAAFGQHSRLNSWRFNAVDGLWRSVASFSIQQDSSVLQHGRPAPLRVPSGEVPTACSSANERSFLHNAMHGLYAETPSYMTSVHQQGTAVGVAGDARPINGPIDLHREDSAVFSDRPSQSTSLPDGASSYIRTSMLRSSVIRDSFTQHSSVVKASAASRSAVHQPWAPDGVAHDIPLSPVQSFCSRKGSGPGRSQGPSPAVQAERRSLLSFGIGNKQAGASADVSTGTSPLLLSVLLSQLVCNVHQPRLSAQVFGQTETGTRCRCSSLADDHGGGAHVTATHTQAGPGTTADAQRVNHMNRPETAVSDCSPRSHDEDETENAFTPFGTGHPAFYSYEWQDATVLQLFALEAADASVMLSDLDGPLEISLGLGVMDVTLSPLTLPPLLTLGHLVAQQPPQRKHRTSLAVAAASKGGAGATEAVAAKLRRLCGLVIVDVSQVTVRLLSFPAHVAPSGWLVGLHELPAAISLDACESLIPSPDVPAPQRWECNKQQQQAKQPARPDKPEWADLLLLTELQFSHCMLHWDAGQGALEGALPRCLWMYEEHCTTTRSFLHRHDVVMCEDFELRYVSDGHENDMPQAQGSQLGRQTSFPANGPVGGATAPATAPQLDHQSDAGIAGSVLLASEAVAHDSMPSAFSDTEVQLSAGSSGSWHAEAIAVPLMLKAIRTSVPDKQGSGPSERRRGPSGLSVCSTDADPEVKGLDEEGHCVQVKARVAAELKMEPVLALLKGVNVLVALPLYVQLAKAETRGPAAQASRGDLLADSGRSGSQNGAAQGQNDTPAAHTDAAARKHPSLKIVLEESSASFCFAEDVLYRLHIGTFELGTNSRQAVATSSSLRLNNSVIALCPHFTVAYEDTLNTSAKPINVVTVERQAAAYRRMGLGVWAAASQPDVSPSTPAVRRIVLDARQLVVTLPWDVELGASIKHIENWAKAVQQVVAAEVEQLSNLQALKAMRKERAVRGAGDLGDATPASGPGRNGHAGVYTELRLCLHSSMFKIDQHPMEAWLAVRSPLLRSAATQFHLLRHRVLNMYAFKSDSGKFGMFESMSLRRKKESLTSEEAAMAREVSRGYNMACQQAPCEQERGTRDGALMHLTGGKVEATIMLCPNNGAGRAIALQHVLAVDSGSKGVRFSQLLKLHVDVAASSVEMSLCGAAKPLFSCASMSLSGPLGIARQAAAPPTPRVVQLQVTRHHLVDTSLTLKGSRPTPKLYSNLQVVTDDMQICWGPGLDPVLSMVAGCARRLALRDPSLGANSPAPAERLPWWDDLRYMWRGCVKLKCYKFQFVLGKTLSPSIDSTSERLEITANVLEGTWGPSTRYDLRLTHLNAAAYEDTGPAHAAGTLLCVPIVDVPVVCVVLDVDWHLPYQRPSSQHHLYPSPPLADDCHQPAVSIAQLYKAYECDIKLQLQCERRSRQASIKRPSTATVNDFDPALFIGEYQIAFFASLISMLRGSSTDPFKIVKERGTYFARKQPGAAAANTSVNSLFNLFTLEIVSNPLDVVHWTADWHGDDPSHRLVLACQTGSLKARYLMNQPAPGGHPPTATAMQRRRPATTSINLEFDFELTTMQLHCPLENAAYDSEDVEGSTEVADPQLWTEATGTALKGYASADSAVHRRLQEALAAAPSLGKLGKNENSLRSTSTKSTASTASGTPRSLRLRPPIADIGSGSITRVSSDKAANDGAIDPMDDIGSVNRSWSVKLVDLKVFMDSPHRQAVWGMFEHLFSTVLCLHARRKQALQRAQERLRRTDACVGEATPQRPSTAGAAERTQGGSAPDRGTLRGTMPQRQHRRVQSDMSTFMYGGNSGKQTDKRRGAAEVEVLSIADPKIETLANDSLLELLLQQRQADGKTPCTVPLGNAESASGADVEEDGEEAQLGALEDPLSPDAVQGNPDMQQQAFSAATGDAHNNAAQAEWFVEVSGFQMCFQADASKGRVLLAAENAIVIYGLDFDQGQQVTTLTVDEVQAYADKSVYEPDTPAWWLNLSGRKLLPPSESAVRRRIVQPFSISFRTTQSSPMLRNADAPGEAGSSGRVPGAPGPGGNAASREITLRTPRIVTQIDPHEFELVIDIVSTVFLLPPPAIAVLASDWSLVMESDTPEVDVIRNAFMDTRKQLVCIQKEAVTLLSMLGVQQNNTVLHPLRVRLDSRGSGKFDNIELQVMTSTQATWTHKEVSSAMQAYVLRCRDGHPSQEGLQAEVAEGQRLLVQWANMAVAGAREVVDKGKKDLKEAKVIARKDAADPRALRIRLQADFIAWTMCKDDAMRTPLIEASLKGLSLNTARHADNSGSFRFIIRDGRVADLTGSVGQTSATDKGYIAAAWKPNNRWERDNLINITARLGVPTLMHSVYEHVEVLIHPLGVHITDAVAREVWRYFYPGVPEDPPPETPGAIPTLTRPSPQGSVSHSMGSPHGSEHSQGPFVPEGPLSPDDVAGSPVRSHGMDGPGAGGPSPLSQAKTIMKGVTGALKDLRSARKHQRNASLDATSRSTELFVAPPQELVKSGKDKSRTKRRSGAGEVVNKCLFVYVRFNEVRCRITYSGRLVSSLNLSLVLKAKVYDRFEGSWRDVFGKYKGTLVSSVLQSMFIRQDKKFKEVEMSEEDGQDRGRRLQDILSKTSRRLALDGLADRLDARPSRKQELLLGKRLSKARHLAEQAAGRLKEKAKDVAEHTLDVAGRIVEGAKDMQNSLARTASLRHDGGQEAGPSRAPASEPSLADSTKELGSVVEEPSDYEADAQLDATIADDAGTHWLRRRSWQEEVWEGGETIAKP